MHKRHEGLNNKNTLKAEKNLIFVLNGWIRGFDELDEDLKTRPFWTIPIADLDALLGKFWLSVRQEDGSRYKLGTMQTFKYALNRVLKRHGYPDLIKNEEFPMSERSFKTAKKELIGDGLGTTKTTPEIDQEGKKY